MRGFGQVGRGQRRKSRLVPVVVAGLLGVGVPLVVSGALISPASANTSSNGNLAQVGAELRELNHKLARAIQRLEGAKRGGIDVARERRTLNDLEATKLRAVDQFPIVFNLPYSETFTKLSCIDEDIAMGQLVLRQLEHGTIGRSAAHIYVHRFLTIELQDAKKCKDELEVDLAQQPHCTGHAMLSNIYGGQAHQLVADFTCPKPSTDFSLTVPAGYQITGGQASNAASSGYSCNLNSTNTTVDCTGSAPAGSTTYVQMTTSPNPQPGMMNEETKKP